MNNKQIDEFFNSKNVYSINEFKFWKGLEIQGGLNYGIEKTPKVAKRFNKLNEHDKHNVLGLNFNYDHSGYGIEISVLKDSKTNSYLIFYRYMYHYPKQDFTDFVEVKTIDEIVPAIIREIIDNDEITIQWPAIEAKAFYD